MTDPVRITCHCGAVELKVTLTDGLRTARRCDCSYCRRRAVPAVSAPLGGIEVVRGHDALTLYQFGTHTAQHHFCSICGIYMYHRRRSNPNEYGVNMGAIDGVNPAEHEPIPWHDGVNHPSDR
ncbi:aldehyde-activating protein [Salipiger aestuarii]|uniref:Glutathione-dependent formaldehyde-activating enzyme n=1 Tax=Salipiger aestuarii TaxID=568098 RepID=A0A327Y9X9_9RHOB|nr:GFA family protein [Salipiger aestuarii]EIE52128.1 glutathione-dependent formaldehyde-activating, GFA [Citreicella sp. 357]KAA8607125.1 aldehyde-activating protein [Salipiger aestuarii]KAA8611013.1 aldehyde-activating protein [Salipiger aestuarii]KAB2542247.1 aldehyde-activating protein [Salipiger aestuarii]RAK16992.1 glutathione-dependent formaldehyde-activating enzyme [Salipiger aestuarii]